MPWDFEGKKDHLQDDKKNRCSAIRCVPRPRDGSYKVISGDNSYGQDPSSYSFRERENCFVKSESQLPSAENNPCVQVAYFGKTSSEPLWWQHIFNVA